MNKKTLPTILISSLLLCYTHCYAAIDYESLTSALEQMPCYGAKATYSVLLPMFSEPVVYNIELESDATADDTLSVCKYYLEWTLPTPSGISAGFASYADGTHFRFRDTRLQEYHIDDNAESFAPGGDINKGVQNQAQFAELMPQNIGRKLRMMAADSTYISRLTADTIVDGRKSTVVKGVRRAGGYDGMEYTYVFDNQSLRPVKIDIENNPGQIAEQSISVTYIDREPATCDFSIEKVSQRQPEAFEHYRESTFSLASLTGKALPRIVATSISGERFCHEKGEKFSAPALIVFLETAVDSTPELISSVRQAVDMLPGQADVIWAFLDHRADDVAAVLPALRAGETALVNARGAARACGIGALTPVLVFVDRNGKVADFHLGFNQDITSIVIQKITDASTAR